ncbi:MAG TPA: AtpZ/AtpI family protein [Flavobacteriaceae bacterium]|nr:AtpZ/AtpI family protein [Flavobacteriaceae bacterium]
MKYKKDNDGLKKWMVFSGIALQMGFLIGLGAFVGVQLDKKFPNKYPVFTIIFSLTGVFLGLYVVIKQLSKMTKDD